MLAHDVIERAERRVGLTLKGKWHLDRVIGVGGMAAVYEATHRNRNRVAIKMLHPELSLDEGTRSRFLREGYVANTIRHDGAVQVLDDDTTPEGLAFLVMELLQGESVEERAVRKGGLLGATESLQIIEQVLDVLAVAHDQKVVHRDIKPDNLFLTTQGQLKVLDFGIARLHQGDSGATRAGSFMGTPAFAAPEQARGRWSEVDQRTDLFAVGATLFTMLSGVHIHEAETSSEQLALAISAHARSLATVVPDAPIELIKLVDMSVEYDKEDRFQSARAMRAAVQNVLAGLPDPKTISEPPLGTFTHSRSAQTVKLPRSSPLSSPVARAGLGVGIAVVLAMVLLLSAQKAEPEPPPGEPAAVVLAGAAETALKSNGGEASEPEPEGGDADASEPGSPPSNADAGKDPGHTAPRPATAATRPQMVKTSGAVPAAAPAAPRPPAKVPSTPSDAPDDGDANEIFGPRY